MFQLDTDSYWETYRVNIMANCAICGIFFKVWDHLSDFYSTRLLISKKLVGNQKMSKTKQVRNAIKS